MDAKKAASPASPNRLMRAFLASKQRLFEAVSDEGGLFECRFLARLLDREEAGVATATRAATNLDAEVDDLRRFAQRQAAPDNPTPGILDATETAELLRRLTHLEHGTHRHAHQLKALS